MAGAAVVLTIPSCKKCPEIGQHTVDTVRSQMKLVRYCQAGHHLVHMYCQKHNTYPSENYIILVKLSRECRIFVFCISKILVFGCSFSNGQCNGALLQNTSSTLV